jgi:CO dehydrogenase/acetyl-CoA synthase gamma subunit (corrinoid Fe-S protein)
MPAYACFSSLPVEPINKGGIEKKSQLTQRILALHSAPLSFHHQQLLKFVVGRITFRHRIKYKNSTKLITDFSKSLSEKRRKRKCELIETKLLLL